MSKKMHAQGVLNDHSKIDYASGLKIQEYNGFKTITHGGGYEAYKSFFLYFPDLKLSIFMFVNRKDFSPTDLCYEIARYLLNLQPSILSIGDAIAKFPKYIPDIPLNKYTGDYWFPNWEYGGHEFHKIKLEKDTLVYQVNKKFSAKMIPLGKDSFLLTGYYEPRYVKFKEKDNSLSLKVDWDRGGYKAYRYKPVAQEKINNEKFIGKYYSEELDIIYTIYKSGENLSCKYLTSSYINLKPMSKNVFYSGNSVFEFVENRNAVDGFYLNEIRCLKIWFRKIEIK